MSDSAHKVQRTLSHSLDGVILMTTYLSLVLVLLVFEAFVGGRAANALVVSQLKVQRELSAQSHSASSESSVSSAPRLICQGRKGDFCFVNFGRIQVVFLIKFSFFF